MTSASRLISNCKKRVKLINLLNQLYRFQVSGLRHAEAATAAQAGVRCQRKENRRTPNKE